MKKIIWGVLIALGIIVVLYILAVIYSSFRGSSVSTSNYYGETGMESGFAQEVGLGTTASLGDMFSAPKLMRDEAVTPPTAPIPTAPIDQKIIKNGSLDITVDEVEQIVSKITNETSALSGFVQNSSVTEGRNGQKYASLVIRVPVKNFDTAISRIKGMAKVVNREDVNGREVTEEYVDLQASLTHNLAVEAQYLELLKRAQKVEEIIAVREKLDQVQAEIESLKGRMRYLDNQTEMSTISISITSEIKITLPADKWQPWEIVKEAVKKLIVSMQNFVNFIIVLAFGLIALIPYLILILIVFLIAKLIYKKYKKPAKNL
ncbi:MAG: DUF4349 domain-containing protein [Candidatus Parcubacteria bacterium]|nr:DUF4349 domain-containing protein [Candidatus Parcubacteria bacterium]